MRKPSLVLLLLLLVALAHTEIPELIHLSDDTSNDFGVSSFRSQSEQTNAVHAEKAVLAVSVIAPVAVPGPLQSARFPLLASSLHVAGQDLLRLCSVLRT
jgi:hypothetical protein